MKVLVTGAAGFIGFHLAKALLEKGISVVGIDNINNYYDIELKFARLAELGIVKGLVNDNASLIGSSKYARFRFAKIDLTAFASLEKLFIEENFTHVINLAAQAGVRYSLENPSAYIQSNIVGFANILECCRHNKIKHLIYASSSSVYGSNEKIPFCEADRVDSPVSLYAATKVSNELMAKTYNHLYKFTITGLRFFTVYGPWGRPDMAPMLFASAIEKGRTIKVFNNGEMKRDFTYVDDIVEGILRITNLIPDKKCRVLNIGNSKPVELMKFIEIMEEGIGKKAIKEFCPMQKGDVKITYADTSHLEALVNYKPTTSLTKGIENFIKWFKSYQLNN